MNLTFRHRISLLVLLAGVALLTVTAVTLVLGRENARQLTGIETRYVPLIELDAQLKRSFSSIARALEDAAGAGEVSKIDEADRLVAELRSEITRNASVIVANAGNPAELEARLTAYYAVAREVSHALASGAEFDSMGDRIEKMRVAQRAFVLELDAATTPDREKLAAAFATARRTQATSLQIDIAVASVALVLMALMSWRLIRRTVRSLREVSEGVERLARGDFAQSIAVVGHDEISDLAREANRTAERLRAYREQSDRETWIKTGVAELAERTAGELSLADLARNAMIQLATYIEASAAVMFLGDDAGTFRRTAAIAVDDDAMPGTFSRGDESALSQLVKYGTIATREKDGLPGVPVTIAVPLAHESRVLGLLLLGLAAEPSGRTHDLLARVAPLLGIAFRVAESRARTEALLVETQRQASAAEAANKELEAFSYSVAHDLRSPLRGIDGFSQALLEQHAGRLDEEGQRYLHRVRKSAQNMAQLIDGLLSLARITRGEIRDMKVDVSELARATGERLKAEHPDRTVELTIAEGLEARGDSRLLGVVLDNLLGNAWKFTRKTANARVEVDCDRSATPPVFRVRDNGAGFDMAYASKLFGAFQRLHATAEFEGTGIGLATVHRIIRRHQGRIWAEGRVGEGATFYFTLGEPA